jgi:hypothetical protein
MDVFGLGGGSVRAVFLSASVPLPGREPYYSASSPILIHAAVLEFAKLVLGRYRIVWGGHPAITPMIWAAAQSLDVDYLNGVLMYQSSAFEGRYPEENALFPEVRYVNPLSSNLDENLRAMRKQMICEHDFVAGVFIGGMEGVIEEFKMFREYHPRSKVIVVGSTGGAASMLAREQLPSAADDIDFAKLFQSGLEINLAERRATNGADFDPPTSMPFQSS